MKKIILLLVFAFAAFATNAQDLTHSINMPTDGTYKLYTCATSDTLGDATQDTIDFVFRYDGAFSIDKLAVSFQADTVISKVSGIVYSVYGKESVNSTTYTEIIAQDTTADVAGINQVYSAKMDTIATDKSYRYYRVRLFLEASAATYDLLKLDNVELKLYQK